MAKTVELAITLACWYGFCCLDSSSIFEKSCIQFSMFFVAEGCTVLYWSRTSDRVGRRPVIMAGLLGLSLSMYSFGLSKTFVGLVIRCILLV